MIARVARTYGRSPLAVAREPFSETAWAFAHAVQLERFDALQRDGEGLQAASRAAIAFHEPKRLEAERKSFLARLSPATMITVAEARARARRLVASGAMADLAESR